jgi:hypothetical protein
MMDFRIRIWDTEPLIILRSMVTALAVMESLADLYL